MFKDNLVQMRKLLQLTQEDLAENLVLGVPPKGKHLFGLVTVGDKGQIVIPVKASNFLSLANMVKKLKK